MKTLNLPIILLLIFSCFKTAKSQIFSERGIRYGIGIESGLAVNYLAKKYDGIVGGSLQADFPIIDNELFATINSGYNNVFVKSDFEHLVDDMHIIPVKAGFKYFYKKNMYMQSEIGISFLLNKSNCVDGRNKALVIAPQVGIILLDSKHHQMDVGLRFESTGKFYKCDKQSSFIGFRLAYAFVS